MACELCLQIMKTRDEKEVWQLIRNLIAICILFLSLCNILSIPKILSLDDRIIRFVVIDITISHYHHVGYTYLKLQSHFVC